MKKLVADRLAIYVNAVYNNSENHNGTTLIVATIFFAFQVYAKLTCRYTDIALGSARLFGFRLTNNFKRPYFSTSIKDFWNRWHITLSVWLRDYLFLPFAVYLTGIIKRTKYLGIAAEKWIFLFASILTFAICGIWHGVGWTYLIWGILFGIYLTVANWTQGFKKKLRKMFGIKNKSTFYRIYGIAMTFLLVSVTWIFFRANNINDAFEIIKKILYNREILFLSDWNTFLYSIAAIIILSIKDFKNEFYPKVKLMNNESIVIRWITYILLLIYIISFGVLDNSQFIYFQY